MSHATHHRPKCPYCSSTAIHRHGRTSAGRLRYRCLPCNRTFTRRTGTATSKVRLHKQLFQFKRLMVMGNPVRHDARILGVSPSTVWRWRHREMNRFATEQAAPRLPKVTTAVQVHMLLPRRTFWGNLPNPTWANRHQLDFLSELRLRCDHLNACSSVVFAASQPRNSKVSFRVLAYHGELERSVLFTDAPSEAGETYQVTGTWAIPLASKKETPIPMHAVLLDPSHRHINAARQAVQELQTAFKRWTARFRGVAMRYLRSYIAWFTTLLERGDIDSPRQHQGQKLRWQCM